MNSDQLPVCVACGSQYDSQSGEAPANCKICDDPRQYVPPTGQAWTTLSELRKTHRNEWTQDPLDSNVWFISTEPKFGIGQRACFIQTPHGNVLWDLVALLDPETVDMIKAKGGLTAIVISHPHFFTTYADWSETFNCRIWIGSDDQEWLCRTPPKSGLLSLIHGPPGAAEQLVPGMTAVKTGGHFDSSLVLHYKELLFIADSIMTIPAALTPHPRPKGMTSYSFMWSIPNQIPLAPPQILQIWRAVEPFKFNTTYGAFHGMVVHGKDVKRRVLDSMQIQVRFEGWMDHELLRVVLPD